MGSPSCLWWPARHFGVMRQFLAASLLLIFAPLRAEAWAFSADPVCTLSHNAPWGELRVIFDPARSEPYAISLSMAGAWPEGPSFAILFVGPQGRTIATNRQSLSEDRRTLTVTDRGFGNVLDGIEFNARAYATLADIALPIDLSGAAGPMARFRACKTAPAV